MASTDTLLTYVTRGYDDQEVHFDIPISVYPGDSGIVIVNSPGASETKDGRNNRWDTLAQHLQDQRVGTVVTYNPPLPDARFKYPDESYSYRGVSWNKLVVESLVHVIDYTLENAKNICGSSTPILYLAGFSAGGSACGSVAYLYPEVQRILLVSAYDSVGDYFYDGIERFTGEVYMAYGVQDVMAGFLAYSMRFIAPRISLLRTQEVPDCDHGFTGATNSKILGNAFMWAFAGDKKFPAPDDGLTLYSD